MTNKGKCFSKADKGQRLKSDDYQTPYSMVQQLIDNTTIKENFYNQKVLEPASGKGSIVKVLQKNGFETIINYDKEKNFLTETRMFDLIITNPPFRIANQFIEKAMELTEEFYFLMPLVYLHGQTRYNKFFSYKNTHTRLNKVYVFTRMPMLTRDLSEDGLYNTGMQVYAWFYFTRNHNDYYPKIFWIDNNKFIRRKIL